MGRRYGGVPPKLISLLVLLNEHGEEVEYDLSVYHHGLQLSELWTGGLSWRRLGVLIKHLPIESATKTAIRNSVPVDSLRASVSDVDTQYGAWSQTDMLLAHLIDIATWLRWTKTKAAEDQPKSPPEPYPRPGVNRKTVANPVNSNVISLLEYVRANGGAPPAGFVTA